MSSVPRPAPISRSILLLLLTASVVSACATPIVTPRAALPCSALVPQQLIDDVPPTDFVPDAANVGDLWIALDGQTGQLDKANTFKRATIDIVKACEARDAAVDAMLTRRKFLGIF